MRSAQLACKVRCIHKYASVLLLTSHHVKVDMLRPRCDLTPLDTRMLVRSAWRIRHRGLIGLVYRRKYKVAEYIAQV